MTTEERERIDARLISEYRASLRPAVDHTEMNTKALKDIKIELERGGYPATMGEKVGVGSVVVQAAGGHCFIAYECALCAEQHEFPVRSKIDIGRFLASSPDKTLPCTKPGPTFEENVLGLLSDMAETLKKIKSNTT